VAEVGIRMTMTENVSSIAPKISESLRGISQAGEDMTDALQLGDLEEKYKSFAERIDKIRDMQQAKQGEVSREVAPARVSKGAGMARPEQIMRGAGGVAQTLGATGDVTAAAPGIATVLKGVLGALGPIGMAIGAAAGGLMITNVLSKQYEKVLPEIMALTAAFGELGETSKETSQSFRETMKGMGETAAEFGYSLEVGMQVAKTMAEVAGVGRAGAKEGVTDVLAYARGMGVAPGALARPRAIGERFGQEEVLGIARGGLMASGMGRGQYQEFLNAMLGVFEDGLSRGITRGFAGIATTQAWISQMGEAYKGQYGLSFYRKLEGATVGAPSLQSERDVILYRAAKIASGEESYIGVAKYLEKGPTQELMAAVGEIVKGMTGEVNQDMILWLRNLYGITITQAEDLANLLKEGKFLEAVGVVEAPDAASKEKDILTLQQEMVNRLTKIGTYAMYTKEGMMSAADSLLKLLDGLVKDPEGELSTIQRGLKTIGIPGMGKETVGESFKNDPVIQFFKRIFSRDSGDADAIRDRFLEEGNNSLINSINNNTAAIEAQTEEFKKTIEIEAPIEAPREERVGTRR